MPKQQSVPVWLFAEASGTHACCGEARGKISGAQPRTVRHRDYPRELCAGNADDPDGDHAAGQRKADLSFATPIRKNAVLSKEAVYIAFPFAVQNPEFRYETQNGWVNPAKDELLGGSREWYAAGHWRRCSGDGVSAAIIPRDAPLVSFGDIVRGNWPSKFEPKTASCFFRGS